MEESKTIVRTIAYRLDSHGHYLSETPCPFWRTNNHGVTDAAVFVGTAECRSCRWYCSKNVEEHTIECAVPRKLAARYDREHKRLMKQASKTMIGVLKAAGDEALKTHPQARLHGTVRKTRHNIYEERYNKGGGRVGWRHVAEICVGSFIYRFRSASYERCWAWVNNIREIYRHMRAQADWQNRDQLSENTVIRLASLGLLPKKAVKLKKEASQKRVQETYRRAMETYNKKYKTYDNG